jgi:hypothetical protein
VYLLAGAALALVVVGSALAWGVAEAAGALVGGLVMLANFAGLEWGARRLTSAHRSGTAGPVRRAVWIGVGGIRLVLAGAALAGGLMTGVGVRGLALSLLALPTAVVAAGLRNAAAERAA